LKKEALLKFLGSKPSKTEVKHLLPNPEFSSVLSGDFRNQFCEFVFVIVCLSLISMANLRQNVTQVLDNVWTAMDKK
jgi:hypothetical protein